MQSREELEELLKDLADEHDIDNEAFIYDLTNKLVDYMDIISDTEQLSNDY